MEGQSKSNGTHKKEMGRAFIKRFIGMILVSGLFGAAFGLPELLALIQAATTLIVGVIIAVYPFLFGYVAYRQGFGKAWCSLNPGIYVRMVALMALFDMEPEDII